MTSKPKIRVTSEPLLTHCACGGDLKIEYKSTIIPNKFARSAECKDCHVRHFSHVSPAASNDVESTGSLVCRRCQTGTHELFSNRIFNMLVCRVCNEESKAES